MVERDWLFPNCYAGEHDWEFVGGRNAGCAFGSLCACSVPVHRCRVCGDYDYGVNAEAAQIMADCIPERCWIVVAEMLRGIEL